MSTQHMQDVSLFLVLTVNPNQFQSYTLLLLAARSYVLLWDVPYLVVIASGQSPEGIFSAVGACM